MTLFRSLAALLCLALAACETMPPPRTGPSYYVMRHLQKADGPDPGLSAEGQANARRLIGFFATDRPRVIYVSTTKRALETAEPLASRVGAKIRRYDPADTPQLIARVSAERGPVLIVGHSNTVPEIVARLGGERPAPLAETDYGTIWHLWGAPIRTQAVLLTP